MWELIQYHLDASDYYRDLSKQYYLYGNDRMSAYADLKAARHYNMALTYWDREYWSKAS